MWLTKYCFMCNLQSYPKPKFNLGDDIISNDIVVALIALVGTCVGSFGGIIASSKLTSYRLKILEKKVDKHNNFAARMPVVEEQIKVINHRIEDLESRSDCYENKT